VKEIVNSNRKWSEKPDNLLEWQTWLEGELAAPLSHAVGSNPELRRVLTAFLSLVNAVRETTNSTGD
jgi:hypothetical protein